MATHILRGRTRRLWHLCVTCVTVLRKKVTGVSKILAVGSKAMPYFKKMRCVGFLDFVGGEPLNHFTMTILGTANIASSRSRCVVWTGSCGVMGRELSESLGWLCCQFQPDHSCSVPNTTRCHRSLQHRCARLLLTRSSMWRQKHSLEPASTSLVRCRVVRRNCRPNTRVCHRFAAHRCAHGRW